MENLTFVGNSPETLGVSWSSFKLFVVSILSVIVTLNVYFNSKKKKLSSEKFISSLPGPRQFPLRIIGNVLQMLPRRHALKALAKWSTEYGPCYRLTVAGQPFVCLNSPELIKELLKSSNPGHLTKSPVIYDLMKPLVRNGMIASKGDVFNSHKKVLMRTMSFKSLIGYMPLLNRHGIRMTNQLKSDFNDNKCHPIYSTINLAFFETICEMATGFDIHDTEEGKIFHHNAVRAQEIMAIRVLKPWLLVEFLWKLHPLSKTFRANVAASCGFAKRLIEQQKANRLQGVTNSSGFCSILDEMLNAEMSDDEILDEVMVMLIAGHETSANAMHFFCFLMALNSDCQKKCQHEIDSVLQNTDELTMADLANLKYLERCIMETLRLFPSAYLFARQLESPLDIGNNQQIPANTNVMLIPWAIHRNPEYFPDPEVFEPNRFLPEEIAKRHSHAYFPFSGGQRQCLGFKFAMMQLKVVAAHVLRHFEIFTTDKMEDVAILPFILLNTERDYNFFFKRRVHL